MKGRRAHAAEDQGPARGRPRRRAQRPEDGARLPARHRGGGRGGRWRRGGAEGVERRCRPCRPRRGDAAHDRATGCGRASPPPPRPASADPLDVRQRAVLLRGAQGRRFRVRAQIGGQP